MFIELVLYLLYSGHLMFKCSPEADDYVSNLSKQSSLRVMLLSRVVVGRPYKRYRNATDFVAPPQGYDSVRENFLADSVAS